jgi:hypothetical protein
MKRVKQGSKVFISALRVLNAKRELKSVERKAPFSI